MGRLINTDDLMQYAFGNRKGLIHTADIDKVPSAQPDKDALDDAYAHGWTDAESKYRKMMDEQPDLHSNTPNTLKALDCISRRAAIDAVSKYNFDFPQYMERFVTELRDAMKADLKHDIKALPSAQPEIVLCIDCKRYDTHGHRCKFWNHGVTGVDWCSKSEPWRGESNDRT